MIPETDGRQAQKVELVSISKTFLLGSGRRVEALVDVNLQFPEGQFVCIIGPSGCGKSTLLNVIAGLIDVSKGEILVEGRKITAPGRDRGMVFQDDVVFLWRKVRGNVEYGLEMQGISREERRERVDQLLRLVGLSEFADAYPKELSGGMRKRVALAMVLANEPDVLLMDEPFGSLDYPTKVGLQKALLEIWAKTRRTVLFVTHDIEEAIFLADRIIVLVAGRVMDDISITFPRPRSDDLRTSQDFQAMKHGIWRYIEADARSDLAR